MKLRKLLENNTTTYITPKWNNSSEGKFNDAMGEDINEIGNEGDVLLVPNKLYSRVEKILKTLNVKFTKD
jgi:hypothetical protein